MIVDGFVGADPAALAGMAEILEQYALRIRASGLVAEAALLRRPKTGETLRSVLVAVEASLNAEAEELRWRARLIDDAQSLDPSFATGVAGSMRHRIEFASLAVFGVANWEEALREWLTVPDPAVLRAMTPAQAAAIFAGMGPSLATDYARSHPSLLGGLDGAPPRLRYTANSVLIAAEIADLQARIAEVESSQGKSWSSWLMSGLLVEWYSAPDLTRVLTGYYTQQIVDYQRWLDEGRQILLFDPKGDGRVVEVFGDLAAANHVGVVIPGMSNDLGNFSEEGGGFRDNAAGLYEMSLNLGSPSVATIAWLGYDSPDGVGATTRGAATDGAPALCRFLEGIDPGADKQVTVIAHSYGSVVAGLAAGSGIAVDDLVFVGSPGTTLDHADDAMLRPGGRVWVALAEDDPIALGMSPRELPPSWVPAPLLPALIAIDLAIAGPEELWHGANPASEGFGATRLATQGSSGHSEYFTAGSLHNLGLVVQGMYDEVAIEG